MGTFVALLALGTFGAMFVFAIRRCDPGQSQEAFAAGATRGFAPQSSPASLGGHRTTPGSSAHPTATTVPGPGVHTTPMRATSPAVLKPHPESVDASRPAA